MKVGLKGKMVCVDFVTVGIYDSGNGQVMFDSALAIEGVIKEINYKVPLDLVEITRLIKEQFNETNWKIFLWKRGLQ